MLNYLSIPGFVHTTSVFAVLLAVPNQLSTLGVIHTIISGFAIMLGLVALIMEGKISPTSDPGKTYIILTIITCITGFPIMRTGHLTGGHYLSILILILLPIGIYAKQLRIFGKLADYVQVIVMSATLFFSFIPAIIETLTRLPISEPVATDQNAPIVQMALKILVALFLTGVIYQVVSIRSRKRKPTREQDGSVNMG